MSRPFLCALGASLAFFALSPFALTGVQVAQAAASEMAVRTGEHPDFDRIVFDAPKGTTYQLTRKGSEVTLAFSRAAQLLLAPFELSRAKDLSVVSGFEGDDPLVVRFQVDPAAQVRSFYSNASIVVDITGARALKGASPKTAAPAQSEPKAKEKKEKLAAPVSAPAAVSAAAAITPPVPASAAPAAASAKAVEATAASAPPVKNGQKSGGDKAENLPSAPAAQAQKGKSDPAPVGPTAGPAQEKPQANAAPTGSKSGAVQGKPPEKAAPEAAPAATAATTAPTAAAAPAVAVPEAAPAPSAPILAPPEAAGTTSSAAARDHAPAPSSAPTQAVDRKIVPPVEAKAPLTAKEIETLLSIAQEDPPQPVAVFDPGTVVGIAVYTRADSINIIFDRLLAASVLPNPAGLRVRLENDSLPQNTALHIPVPQGIEARVEQDKTAWKLYLVKSGAPRTPPAELLAQPDFALGARLLVMTASPSEPVFFTDPVVGDRLMALPLRDATAFSAPRRFADFRILPAAQGLVVQPYDEKLVARIVPDGIEITSEGGLRLSGAQDTGAAGGGGGAAKNLPRLFDLSRWRGREQDGFIGARQKLLDTVIKVPDEQKVLARLDIARFLFAYGMGLEAAAKLDTLPAQLPEIENQRDFLALRGAARILAGRVESGMADLSNGALREQGEAALWRAYGSALLHDWEAASDGFRQTVPYLAAYPDPLRSRLTIMAIESALAAGRREDAAAWLASFENAKPASWAMPAIHYLRGVLYSLAGRNEKAGVQWRLAARGADRLYKIRAELALVDLGVGTKSMTPRQAADRLEGLRFAWRGDDLEFDILRRLGEFYIDAKEYRKGLATMAQAARLYPSLPQTPALRAEMAKLFGELFVTKSGDSLSPLEALSLYSDFRFLIPQGEAGNAIRRNLAEKLVAIDLLDPAGALLTDIIKNSEDATFRAKTATRLAGIRLLDHKPDAALAALDQSQNDAATLGEEEARQRQLLRARALSEKGQYDAALDLLQGEVSREGNVLRADMAMRARRWDDAAKALLALVGPPVAGQALDAQQEDWLISAATAFAQAGNLDELDRLADAYGQPMAKAGKADLFHILTRPEKTTQMKDLSAAQAKLSEVDLFRSFLNAYRDEKK